MKGLDQRGQPAPQGGDKLSHEEELDLKIAVATAKKLLMEGDGIKLIADAIKTSKDPTSVIGQFFATMFAQMHEKFPKNLSISPNVYLCRGGVLEQMLDFLEKKIGLPSTWSDKVFDATVETIKAASQGERGINVDMAQQQGAPPQEEAMPPEQQAAPPQQPMPPPQQGMM